MARPDGTVVGMSRRQQSQTQTLQSARTTAVPAIELRGLTKSFGSVRAVRGIDLTVRPGEIIAFLGPNGAGKTTTIDMMLGLSRPDDGSVQVYGMEPSDAVRHGLISAVMQTGGLLKDLTVEETLRLTASLFGNTRPVAEVLGTSRHLRHRRPSGRQVLGRPAATAAVRDGPAAGPRAARPRRTDHRHGRDRSPRLLGRHPRGRRAGPHGALRDALPGGGGRLRRPHRPRQPRPGRRRRHGRRR